MLTSLYIFQWISDLGGADTRLKELLILLHKDYKITCIPNDDSRLKEKYNTDFLDKYGILYQSFDSLPKKLSGFAYSNSNFRVFSNNKIIRFIKDSGLKLLWSNDMMWHTKEELDAISNNMVEVVLYTSPFHRTIMHTEVVNSNGLQKTFIIENYFDSSTWPYLKREKKEKTTFGKVSRDDELKFSDNFPIFYEQVTNGVNADFSILGWSEKINKLYSWYNFGDKWSLYNANKIPTIDWFNKLDVFLYDCNYRFIENQSRAIIESQLTGAPVIAPKKWNFTNMIENTETGFLWDNVEEACEQAMSLSDFTIRTSMGKKASDMCNDKWCNVESSIKKWNKLLEMANKRIEVNA